MSGYRGSASLLAIGTRLSSWHVRPQMNVGNRYTICGYENSESKTSASNWEDVFSYWTGLPRADPEGALDLRKWPTDDTSV